MEAKYVAQQRFSSVFSLVTQSVLIASDFLICLSLARFCVCIGESSMNSSSKIVFRLATLSEHDRVLQFLRQHFFNEEPINNAYPIKDESMEEEFILSLLTADEPRGGGIILAIDSNDDKKRCDRIVGLLAYGRITRSYAKESWDESETTTNLKWKDILKFMSYIESKSNVCERFDVDEALHIHSTAVDSECRGRAIGKLLFAECFRIARDQNFRLVSAECTSVYSVRIAESLGMRHVSTVTYDEYNRRIGYEMFTPIAPHYEIKSFVKQV